MSTSTASAAGFLGSLDLFSHLSEDEVREVASAARPFELPAETWIFRQGDAADEMYALDRGAVALVADVGGDEVEIARLGAGAVLGEMALVDTGARPASARTLEAVSGYRIARWSFDVLRAAFRPSWNKTVRRLGELLAVRLRDSTSRLLEGRVSDLSVQERTASPPRLGMDPSPSTPAALDRANLVRLPVFAAFTAQDVETLLGHMEGLDVPRGTLVFDRDDPADAAYVVVRGAVESGGVAADGVMKLALWGPGSLFGVEALFVPEPRLTRALAREDTTLLRLGSDRFHRLQLEGSVPAYKLCDSAARLLVDALKRSDRRGTWRAVNRHLGTGGRP